MLCHLMLLIVLRMRVCERLSLSCLPVALRHTSGLRLLENTDYHGDGGGKQPHVVSWVLHIIRAAEEDDHGKQQLPAARALYRLIRCTASACCGTTGMTRFPHDISHSAYRLQNDAGPQTKQIYN